MTMHANATDEEKRDSGAGIKELRTKTLKVSQEELAHALGVTVSTVNRWENGHTMPSKLAQRAIDAIAERGSL